jgi:hypothetical protein
MPTSLKSWPRSWSGGKVYRAVPGCSGLQRSQRGLTIGCSGCGALHTLGAMKVLRVGPAPLTLASLGAAGPGSGAAHPGWRRGHPRCSRPRHPWCGRPSGALV